MYNAGINREQSMFVHTDANLLHMSSTTHIHDNTYFVTASMLHCLFFCCMNRLESMVSNACIHYFCQSALYPLIALRTTAGMSPSYCSYIHARYCGSTSGYSSSRCCGADVNRIFQTTGIHIKGNVGTCLVNGWAGAECISIRRLRRKASA